MDWRPPGSLCSWDSPGKKPGMGSHSLPDPGIELAALLCLLHWDRGFFTTCATESRSQWVEGGGGGCFFKALPASRAAPELAITSTGFEGKPRPCLPKYSRRGRRCGCPVCQGNTLPQKSEFRTSSFTAKPCLLRYFCFDCPLESESVGSLSFLQGIFPTQGLNPCLVHCRRILYQLRYQGSPRLSAWNMVNMLRSHRWNVLIHAVLQGVFPNQVSNLCFYVSCIGMGVLDH